VLDGITAILSDPRLHSLAIVLVGILLLRDAVRAILSILDSLPGRRRRR
jgi:hypothetical protein